jgi:hypothetical protein
MAKICEICKKEFSLKIEIDGKIRNLQRRKFCLECSPFRKHNTSKIPIRDGEVREKRKKETKRKYNIKKSQRVTEWRRRTKIKLIDLKGGKCIKCGYDKKVPDAYCFHHREPSIKDFGISRCITKSFERLKKEVEKCDLLCVRCHAELHFELNK